MIKYIGVILLAIAVSVWTATAATIFQITIVNVALIAGLMFILKPGYWYLLWSLCVGLFFDYFSGAPVLFYTIIFLATLSATRYINSLFSHENLTRFFLLSLFAVIAYQVLTVVIAILFSQFNAMEYNFILADMLNLKLLLEIIITFILVIFFRFISAAFYSHKPHIAG